MDASLIAFSNQRSSLSSTPTWASSKECPLSFRCRCPAESCPEEAAICVRTLVYGAVWFPQFTASLLALDGRDDVAVCVLVFCPWGGPASVFVPWVVLGSSLALCCSVVITPSLCSGGGVAQQELLVGVCWLPVNLHAEVSVSFCLLLSPPGRPGWCLSHLFL